MASYVIFNFKASKERHRINFDGPGITVFELKREIVNLFRLGPGKDSDLFIYDAGTDEEYTDDNAVVPKTYEVYGKRRPAARPGHGTTARYASARAAPKPRRQDPAAASAKPANTDFFAAMENAKTEDEKIRAMMHGEDAQWAEKKKELSLAQAVPFRGQPQPGENTQTPPGYICHRCNLPGHFKKFCPTLNDPTFVPKARPVKTTGIPTTMLEVINDPSESDSDQASKAYMINRSGNRVRVKIDNAVWAKEQAIKRTAKRRAADDESENDEDDSDEEQVIGAKSKARMQSPKESDVKPDSDAKHGVGSESKESHAQSPKRDSEVTPSADTDAEVKPPAKRPRMESPADGVDAKEDTDAESKKGKKKSPKQKAAEPVAAPTAPAAMRKQQERERLVKQGINPQFLDDMEKLSQGMQMPDANAMNAPMMGMNPAAMAAMNGMNMNGMFFPPGFGGFPNQFGGGGFGWGMPGMPMPNMNGPQAWRNNNNNNNSQQQRPPAGPQRGGGFQQGRGGMHGGQQFQQNPQHGQQQQQQQQPPQQSTQPQSHQGKQFGGAAAGNQSSEEQSPYFRQPVNPHRHQRQKHLRPSEYTELGNR